MRDEALRLNDELAALRRDPRCGRRAGLIALLAAGCADQQEKYCDAVKDHQQELGEVLGDGGAGRAAQGAADLPRTWPTRRPTTSATSGGR